MTVQKRPALSIELTEEQSEALEPLFQSLWQIKGGTVVAQVWTDGMRVTVLDKAASDAFAQPLGGWRDTEPVGTLAESMARAKPLN